MASKQKLNIKQKLEIKPKKKKSPRQKFSEKSKVRAALEKKKQRRKKKVVKAVKPVDAVKPVENAKMIAKNEKDDVKQKKTPKKKSTPINDTPLETHIIETQDYTDIYNNYDIANNTTRPILTKYEQTMMIGKRATQLACGAEPLIEVDPDITDTIQIAEEELIRKKIPFMVRRSVGNRYEYWRIEDLEILMK